MIKKAFLAALTLCVATVSFAQNAVATSYNEEVVTNNSVVTEEAKGNSFWSNTFITVGAGAQYMYTDHDQRMDFGDRLTPAFTISVGKWFIPAFGIRLGITGLNLKGATQDGLTNESEKGHTHSNGVWYSDKHWLYEQEIDYFNLHGDVMFNVSNALFGYNAKRFWNCSPYIGFSWVRVFDGPTTSEFGGNIGIYNSFRLTDGWHLNLDVRGTLVSDDFDNEVGGRRDEGIIAATIGVTYNFKPRGWKERVVTVYDNTEITRLRNAMNDLMAENDRLKNVDSDTVTVVKKIVAPCMVVFPKNISVLTEDARVNIGMFAKKVKSLDSGIVYSITGYADAATGNETINERLSRERAEAVLRCLVDEFGLPESQFVIDHKGGVGNMFYDNPELSRTTIIEVKSVPATMK